MMCVPRDLPPPPPVQVLGQTFVDLKSKSISFVCGVQRFVSARERGGGEGQTEPPPLGDLILKALISLIEFFFPRTSF